MRTFNAVIFFTSVCLAATGAASSQAPLLLPTDLTPIGQAMVTDVIDGDTLVLDNGNEVRLTGIQAPKLPLGRPNFNEWPLAHESKQALEELALGQNIAFYGDENTQDRYRRILAQAVRNDGVWLQGTMVENGLARVYTFADNRRVADALYQLEKQARQDRQGLWALDHYRVRPSRPDVLVKDVGTFQIVEGRVVDAAKVRSRIYLNFGEDYRTDFTASI